MKWLSILLLALIATTAGTICTDGMVKYVFQIGFFCTIGLSFIVLSKGVFNTA